MIPVIILASIFIFLIILARHDAYKKGQIDLKNEIAKKELSIKQKQIDIANSPSDRVDDVLEWLSGDSK